MGRKESKVAKRRSYAVLDVKDAKRIATEWLSEIGLVKRVKLGLPEIDDRYHFWRIVLLDKYNEIRVGEIVIDAKNSLLIGSKTTSEKLLEDRLLGRKKENRKKIKSRECPISYLRNTIALGDSEEILEELPAESIDLIFTSPPYFNARPEYAEYLDYHDYLEKMRRIIRATRRVLSEGRFFVINISPVLIRRKNRNSSSRRLAVPFDFHKLFTEEGFDFIDDIIWKKPSGAGWATGRGRRFAADRNPLQYKPVPVTEYILVYRKHTERLIDWNIRNHPNQSIVEESKIGDDYETTNIWDLKPAYDKRHPAIFPVELAERVINYYSFINDVVLDPFAGIGTVGEAATKSKRRFVLIDNEIDYINVIRDEAKKWLGPEAEDILTIGCKPIKSEDLLI